MMAWGQMTVLAAAAATCLVTATSAAGDYTNSLAVAEEKTLLTEVEKDSLGVLTAQVVTLALLILAALYIVAILFAPAFLRRSLSWDMWGLLSTDLDGLGLLDIVMSSIDPVESAFAILQVEELACRRRTVCELQQAATRMPLVASLVKYISPSIRGLEMYKEAQEAGSALEDCALLFAECPTSTVQNLWGNK